MTAVAARLAEITWQVVEGDVSTVERFVVAAGGSWDESGGTWTARTVHGVTVGFVRGLDPVSAFAQTAFALVGPLWALVPECDEAMTLVKKRWSADTKARREAAG